MQIHGQTPFAEIGGGGRIGKMLSSGANKYTTGKTSPATHNVRRYSSRYAIEEREDNIPSGNGLVWEPPCPCASTDRSVTLASREEASEARSGVLMVDPPSIGMHG